jgi:FkbM family methyltransferase
MTEDSGSTAHASDSQVTIVTTPAGRWMLYRNDFIASELISGRGWEPHFEQVVAHFLRDGDVAIDFGANFGFNACVMAQRVGASGAVHAFEPLRVIFQQLCGNVFLNNLRNVHTYHCAMGDVDGQVVSMDPVDLDQSFVNIGNTRIGAGGEAVLQRTLDALNLPRVDFIKMDVQGSEWKILQGSLHTLARCRPIMFVEIEEHHLRALGSSSKQLIEGLLALDYTLVRIITDYPCDHVAIPVERAAEIAALQASLLFPTEVIRGKRVALEFSGARAAFMYSKCTVLDALPAEGIAFIQEFTPNDYSAVTDTQHSSLGGTEASVLRVAAGIDARIYCLGKTPTDPCDAAVHVRSAWTIAKTQARRHFFWLHDDIGDEIDDGTFAIIKQHRPTLVFPSHYLKQRWAAALSRRGDATFVLPTLAVIANPVELQAPTEMTRITVAVPTFIWAAAPQKGLQHAIRAFEEIRRTALPNAVLKIAYPEYGAAEFQSHFSGLADAPGVELLHSLPHAELLEQFRRSHVLLHTNPQFAETFGILFAEAGAFGVRVVTHQHGAAAEVLGARAHFAQCFDAVDVARVAVEAFNASDAPFINAAFMPDRVHQAWRDLMAAPPSLKSFSSYGASGPTINPLTDR